MTRLTRPRTQLQCYRESNQGPLTILGKGCGDQVCVLGRSPAAMWAARSREGGHAGHLQEALRLLLTTQNSPKAYPASLHRRVSGKGLGVCCQHLPAKPSRPHAATLSPLGYESPAQQVTGRVSVIQGFWGKRRPAARKGITYTRQRCRYRHLSLQGTFRCLVTYCRKARTEHAHYSACKMGINNTVSQDTTKTKAGTVQNSSGSGL